jgi:dephospho-CoA kinase
MKLVGLTGNIGSGKSVIAKIFETLGVPVYNADARAKVILSDPETINKVVTVFGKNIIDKSGNISREKLASIVFADKKQIAELNNIIHPAVIADFKIWVGENFSAPYVIMESAILFDTDYYKLFDKIIIVSAPENIRILRVLKRDNISEDSLRMRIQNQKPESEFISDADFVIINDCKSLVIPQVLNIHNVLKMP